MCGIRRSAVKAQDHRAAGEAVMGEHRRDHENAKSTAVLDD
jgi:hypothetical protein